jgi:lipoprotein-releasing system permease protein
VRLSLYIAKRYLFAKKSRNAINIISAISVAGVAVGTMALIIVLSVFNGLELMVSSIFNTFDPELKITAVEGKSFRVDSVKLQLLSEVGGVAAFSLTLEENALLRYDDRQFIATIKGVDDNYDEVTGIKEALWDGEYVLRNETGTPYCVPGVGVAQYLGMRLNFINPLFIYVPDKSAATTTLNPESSFHREYIYPSAIFQVEQSYDSRYVFMPLDFVRELIDNEGGITSIDIKLQPKAGESAVRSDINKIFGDGFKIQNRFEQQELYYKVMKSERMAIFLILTLILIIASFNIIGSLTMLIIEKRRDVEILKSLGADKNLIRKIFLFEGWMISILGAIIGVVAGFVVCWLQQTFGLVKFNSETLLIDSYPIALKLVDFIIVPSTVLLIGYVAAWYPVRYLTKKYLSDDGKEE